MEKKYEPNFGFWPIKDQREYVVDVATKWSIVVDQKVQEVLTKATPGSVILLTKTEDSHVNNRPHFRLVVMPNSRGQQGESFEKFQGGI